MAIHTCTNTSVIYILVIEMLLNLTNASNYTDENYVLLKFITCTFKRIITCCSLSPDPIYEQVMELCNVLIYMYLDVSVVPTILSERLEFNRIHNCLSYKAILTLGVLVMKIGPGLLILPYM